MIPVVFDKPGNIWTADTRRQTADKKFCVRPRLSSEQREPRGAGCKHGRFIKKIAIIHASISFSNYQYGIYSNQMTYLIFASVCTD